MVHSCYVSSCENKTDSKKVKEQKISFFSFPKDEERAKIWAAVCKRTFTKPITELHLHKHVKICSEHFETRMFMNDLRNRLFDHAVPTLDYNNDFYTNEPPDPLQCQEASDFLTIILEETSTETVPTPETSTDPLQNKKSTHRSREERLRKQIVLKNNIIKAKNREINKLKETIKRLSAPKTKVEELKDLITQSDRFFSSRPALAKFIRNQATEFLKRNAKSNRYSSDTVKLCLKLYYSGPKAYRVLQDIFFLPDKRTLQRYIQNIELSPDRDIDPL